jgi:hypothetical protein
VPHVVLIALIVFGLALVGGLGLAVVKGFEAWRTFRRFRRTVLSRLEDVAAQVAKIEARTAKAAGTASRLNESRERLQRSLALARVFAGGASEGWLLVARVRGAVPRK